MSEIVLLVDVQERFLPAIPSIAPDQPVGRRLGQLLAGAALLGRPRLIIEQSPDKLGPTLPHLLTAAGDVPRLAKRHFSAAADAQVAAVLARDPGATVVLAGVEAHVCVLLTARDLRRAGRTVVVCADATASRDAAHAPLALDELRRLGCAVLPVESVLFDWQQAAGDATFKALSALVR